MLDLREVRAVLLFCYHVEALMKARAAGGGAEKGEQHSPMGLVDSQKACSKPVPGLFF